jgi:hypothetical protein
MEQIDTDYRIHVLSYLRHIQPGRPQIPSSGKSQLCSYWSSVEKKVLQLASGLLERCSYWSRIVLRNRCSNLLVGLWKQCSYWSRIVWFLVFVKSNQGVFRYHLHGKTELCFYWSRVKKPVFQLASGLRKRYSYWSKIVWLLVFVISNLGKGEDRAVFLLVQG